MTFDLWSRSQNKWSFTTLGKSVWPQIMHQEEKVIPVEFISAHVAINGTLPGLRQRLVNRPVGQMDKWTRAAVIPNLSRNQSHRFRCSKEPKPEPIIQWNRIHRWNRLQSRYISLSWDGYPDRLQLSALDNYEFKVFDWNIYHILCQCWLLESAQEEEPIPVIPMKMSRSRNHLYWSSKRAKIRLQFRFQGWNHSSSILHVCVAATRELAGPELASALCSDFV